MSTPESTPKSQHMYHEGQLYARVDSIPQSGTNNLATAEERCGGRLSIAFPPQHISRVPEFLFSHLNWVPTQPPAQQVCPPRIHVVLRDAQACIHLWFL
jgi:hypothetical protein